MPRTTTSLHTLVLTNILFMAGGCGDGDNGPQPISFDAPAVEAAFLSVDGVFTSGNWINFAALGQRFILSATPNASVYPEDRVLASRVSIIPPEFLGTTLTFDETEQRYLGDQSRNGAPDDGVRFVLYDVNPTNGQPIAVAENGHADIRDVGGALPDGFAIEIQAVAGQAIFAEYTASFGLPETGALGPSARAASLDHAGLELEGTFGNGSSEVDLVGISGTVNGIEISDVELDLRDGTLSLAADIVQDDATAMLDITMGVQLGPDQFLLTRAGAPETYTAQLSVNGAQVATIESAAGTISVRDASGDALTSEAEAAVRRLAEFADRLPTLLDELTIAVLRASPTANRVTTSATR